MSALIGSKRAPSAGNKVTCSSWPIVVGNGKGAAQAKLAPSTNCLHQNKTAVIHLPVKAAAAAAAAFETTANRTSNNNNQAINKYLAQLARGSAIITATRRMEPLRVSDSLDLVSNFIELPSEKQQHQLHQDHHNHHYRHRHRHTCKRLRFDQPSFSGHLSAAAAASRSPLVSVTCAGGGALAYCFIILVCLLTLTASGGPLAAASAPASGNSKTGNGATVAYSEPIKWSFGGWAPLDGGPGGNQRQNGSLTLAGSGLSSQRAPLATSPIPMAQQQQQQQQRTTARPGATSAGENKQRPSPVARASQNQNQTARQQPQVGESLSESASSARENVQFSLPQQQQQQQQRHHQQQQQQPQQQQHQHHHHHHVHHHHQNRHVHSHQLHGLPAYAMPMLNNQPQQFSAPAPLPIFRDQLLPAANHNQAHRKHLRPEHLMPHHAAMVAAAQQHHHQQMMAAAAAGMPAGIQMRPTMYNQQRNLQQQHRQQMANRYHQPRQQQQQAYRQPHMMSEGQRSIPHYPGSPFMHAPPQHDQVSQSQVQVPQIGAYKVIEGEQPIIFTNSLSNEKIPMIEVSAQDNYRNESEKVAGEQANQTPPYSSTLAAIEKDNLNYQEALRQVSNYMPDEQQQQQQQQQSNNIQDIKQRQQYEQQAAAAANKQAGEKSNSLKSSYLTIPVAVETEGDKVLTSEDINEIEKHVINVLPNLKTADKIVKIADAHLTLANLKSAPSNQPQSQSHTQAQPQQRQQQQVQQVQVQHNPGQEMHQINYEEHRTTLKQLEGDMNQQQPQYEVVTTPAAATTGYRTSATAAISQQTTGGQQVQLSHEKAPDQNQQQVLTEHQYFLATGPLQEVGTIDPDQVADYNLIKNDLLNNFRYEPTRASASTSSSGSSGMGTTPPMPYLAPQRPQQQQQHQQQQQQQQQHVEQPFNRPSASGGPASVTRYFQQGSPKANGAGHFRERGNNLFARLNGPHNQQSEPANNNNNQLSATTRTIMGGRKVSEVMRPLIHTTPVPMTSRLHVASVEPEKVDAIQLIAGQANDKRPMVVEAHQLVNHTPDGGIDYNSGMSSAMLMAHQQQQSQQAPVEYQRPNQTSHQQGNHLFEQQQQQQQQQQQPGQLAHYEPSTQDGDNQGAIIEYVAMTDQALSNAVQQQQQQQRHPEPDSNNNNNNQAPFLYDYTMSTQHQASVSHMNPANENMVQPPTTPTYQVNNNNNNSPDKQQVQQVQQEHQQPSLAWSPSVASEHQQQQLELSEHAAPMQQMDMPATAGYNLFGGQQEQLVVNNGQQQLEHYEQEQQQQQQQDGGHRWRSKAGGSQPNPDAQYDGQIAKSSPEQEASQNSQQEQLNEEQRQQQYGAGGNNYENQPQQQVAANSRPQEEQEQLQHHHNHHQQLQQQQQQVDNGNEATLDGYQQQRYQGQQASSGGGNAAGEQQPAGDAYLTTSSFVGGAQMNGPAPSHGNYEQASQQQPQQYAQTHPPAPEQFTYMKLDRDRQQNHLQQHQVQHQAQLAEIMGGQVNGQQQQQHEQTYQTTTPMSITTLAAIEEQQQVQANNKEQEISQQQQEINQANGNSNENNGYMLEQSRPSVQSSPDSMLINESPIQVPISDQQSLITDQNQDSNDQFSDDDAAKQRQQSQPAGVYQVYQAYYAPKDHKPLPGYVRLSLEEFNELFRDAEIQYVDRGLNNLVNNGQSANNHPQQQQQQQQLQPQQPVADSINSYEQAAAPNDYMKASASEFQSIVVDRRSIPERRSGNSSSELGVVDNDTNDKNGFSISKMKKVISIRNEQRGRAQVKKTKLANKKAVAPLTSSSTVSSILVDSTTPTTTTTPKEQPIKQHSREHKVDKIPHKQVSTRKLEVTTNDKSKNASAQQQQSAKLTKAPQKVLLHKSVDKPKPTKI